MKKQLILSALIFSLSFACVTFAADKQLKTYEKQFSDSKTKELEDYLIDKVFPIHNNESLDEQKSEIANIQLKRKSIKKTRNIVDSVSVGGGIGTIAVATYNCLIGQSNATLFEQKKLTAIISVFSLASYGISYALLQMHRAYKKDYKQKRYDLLVKKSNPIYQTLQKSINSAKKDWQKKIKELASENDSEKTTIDNPEITTEHLYSNQKISGEIKENIKHHAALREYLAKRTDTDRSYYSRPTFAYEHTISLTLFGLACCITWAPEICFNFAKMTNFTKKFPFTKS